MHISLFLFGPYPLALQAVDRVILIAAIVLFGFGLAMALGLWFKDVNPAATRILQRVRSMFLTTGFLGLLWSFFRYENAYYISWRFWIVLVGLGWLLWLGFIIRDYKKNYAQELSIWQRQLTKEKYLRR